MSWNWRKLIPRISWKNEAEEVVELYRTLAQADNLLGQMGNVNRALNIALGQSIEQIDSLRDEALRLFGAITLKHGGELIVEPEFFNTLTESDGKLSLRIQRQDDGSVVFTLVNLEDERDQEELKDVEVSATPAERNEQ